MPNSETFTTGDGCRIAYRLDGPHDAPLVALANSIGTTLQMWEPQIAALTQHRRVLRYDYRGHGESDTPPGAYSADRFGRDVLELFDHLDVARADFIGLSLGGLVGQWLGIRAPERINRLVLANTAAWLGPAPFWDEQISGILGAGDNSALADGFVASWFSKATIDAADARIVPFRQALLAQDRQGLAGALAIVRDSDFRRIDRLISKPTLVLVGEDDVVTTADHGREIADLIPEARLVRLPGTHLTNVELASEFNETVLGFLLQ